MCRCLYVHVWNLSSKRNEGRVCSHLHVMFFCFVFFLISCSHLLGLHEISDQFFRRGLFVLKREDIAILAVGESHDGKFL